MGTNATEAPDYFADAPGYATHEVLNQAGSLADYDAYSGDKPLVEAMKAFGGDWAQQALRQAGRKVGSDQKSWRSCGNQNPRQRHGNAAGRERKDVQPVLHDEAGRRRHRSRPFHKPRHHCQAARRLDRGRDAAGRVHGNQGCPAPRSGVRLRSANVRLWLPGIAARHADCRMVIPAGSAFFPKRRGMQSGYSDHQHSHTVVPPQ